MKQYNHSIKNPHLVVTNVFHPKEVNATIHSTRYLYDIRQYSMLESEVDALPYQILC